MQSGGGGAGRAGTGKPTQPFLRPPPEPHAAPLPATRTPETEEAGLGFEIQP